MSKKKIEARGLWETCFDDPPNFLDLYFSKVYRDKDTLLLYESDHSAVSHIQFLPYRLNYADTDLPIGYISGACTLPEARGRGFMARLMEQAHHKMYSRGDVASVLIPASTSLYDFYARHGYRTCFYRRHISYSDREEETAEQWLKKELSRIDLITQAHHILHTNLQWHIIAEDLHMAGGGILTSLNARVTYLPEKNILHILDLYGNKEDLTHLIISLYKHLKAKTIILRLPPVIGEENEPVGMLRPLHVRPLLSAFAAQYPEIDLLIPYHDTLLPEESGCYQLIDGNVCDRPEKGTMAAYTPSKLVEYLFNNRPGYLNLMLD